MRRVGMGSWYLLGFGAAVALLATLAAGAIGAVEVIASGLADQRSELSTSLDIAVDKIGGWLDDFDINPGLMAGPILSVVMLDYLLKDGARLVRSFAARRGLEHQGIVDVVARNSATSIRAHFGDEACWRPSSGSLSLRPLLRSGCLSCSPSCSSTSSGATSPTSAHSSASLSRCSSLCPAAG
ncbi:MAG: hypothetical protein GY925_14440 [Actinomycetia bacterium]|nr:hypothetical protein [Actinomycetes bacterium]